MKLFTDTELAVTFGEISSYIVPVFLEGRRVGTITRGFDGMWQYFPKGKNEGGQKFPTLALAKASLL
jgi:hypothetical protein